MQRSKVDALLKAAQEKQEQQELDEKELGELKEACQKVFTSAAGIKVAKAMMKVSGIYKLKHNLTELGQAGAERGKEYMYLLFVKAMLTPEQLLKIERGDVNGAK